MGKHRPAVQHQDGGVDPVIDRLPGPHRSWRNPFEVFMMLACAVSGTGAVIGHVPPASISALLDPWERVGWGALIAFGGWVALAGMFWPHGEKGTGPILERIGMVATAQGCLFYSFAVIYVVGVSGIFAATLSFALSLACLRRSSQIRSAIKQALKVGEGGNNI